MSGRDGAVSLQVVAGVGAGSSRRSRKACLIRWCNSQCAARAHEPADLWAVGAAAFQMGRPFYDCRADLPDNIAFEFVSEEFDGKSTDQNGTVRTGTSASSTVSGTRSSRTA